MFRFRKQVKLYVACVLLFYVLWLLHDPSKAFAPEMMGTTLIGASIMFLMFRVMTLVVSRLARVRAIERVI